MRLLVSVRSAMEAVAAREGGADLIDAKDPDSGALGPVTPGALGEILRAVSGDRPVTAALGDAFGEETIRTRTRMAACRGVAFVKIGFAGVASSSAITSLMAAAVEGARNAGGTTEVVGVVYADAPQEKALPPGAMIDAIARAGARGLLIDTALKDGPGLPDLVDTHTLAGWIRHAHRAGLFVALAGRLESHDLSWVRDAGADIAGFRGAACVGGRRGRVVAERVRLLTLQRDAELSARAVGTKT
jgi:(5-formylfuran-3-yl)methyl phosphate synthase